MLLNQVLRIGMSHSDHDRRRYEECVRNYSADVYRFAYWLCGNRDDADDLVQETFYQAWRSIASLRDLDSSKAWLLKIARYRYAHGIRDRSRRLKTKPDLEQLENVPDVSGPDVLTKLSQQELLHRALEELDQRFKEPFLLVFLEDYSCREAADLLDIPLGTVLSRIHRARKFLRQSVRNLDSADLPEPANPKPALNIANGDL